ncbi:class I SAM-dependent methyltransferase [Faunimonas sp. B44]|uniref:class I SAM-dependent methyltransferase n=1 Tax=Faunimonas sp. B44 TaxID=3461493 RepID=UPI004043C6D2
MTGTPLAAKLARLIRANGPITVANYMAICLGDPEHGYYATRDPLGAAGDFTTAPEISQMFGEIVGAWLAHAWALAGAPAAVRIVELGPGRGTLMADVLRVLARVPGLAAAPVHLVETSPALCARQRETLSGHAGSIAWHDRLEAVPEGPILLVANEFFDALPIRQFVRARGAWRERMVGLGEGERLAFGIGPGMIDTPLAAPDGAILEVNPPAAAMMQAIAGRIARHGGAALVIDYGHAATAPGDTLQAVRRHAYCDPLEAPGESDLTAHVDFQALAAAARAGGASVHGPIAQGRFLLDLGLLNRAGQLGAAADEAAREAIRAAVERLAGRDAMGELFKVVAVTPHGLTPPPFGQAI